MPELATPDRVRADFDRIARLGTVFDHNAHYHDLLLRALPARLGPSLDLGCGAGDFTRALAARAESVLGVDLSPQMLRTARERSAGFANVAYEERDVLAWDLPHAHFDCIASIATLHHLPMAATLERFAAALRSGGTLVVLDVVRDATPSDFARSAAAVPVNLALHLAKTGALRDPPDVRRAWAEHGATDHYLSLAEVRAACAAAGLAGARVRRHLLWRYSLVWTKPASGRAPT